MNNYEKFSIINKPSITTFSQLSPQIQKQFTYTSPQHSNATISISNIRNTDIQSLSGLPNNYYNNYIEDTSTIKEQQYSTRIKDDYKKCEDFPVIMKNGQYFTYQLGTGVEIPLELFPITNCGGEDPNIQMNRDTMRMSYLPEIDQKMSNSTQLNSVINAKESFSFLPSVKNYPSIYQPTARKYYENLNTYNTDLIHNPPQIQYNLFN